MRPSDDATELYLKYRIEDFTAWYQLRARRQIRRDRYLMITLVMTLIGSATCSALAIALPSTARWWHAAAALLAGLGGALVVTRFLPWPVSRAARYVEAASAVRNELAEASLRSRSEDSDARDLAALIDRVERIQLEAEDR